MIKNNIKERTRLDNNGLIALIGLGATGSPLAHLLFKKYGDRFAIISDEDHAQKLEREHIYINGELFNSKVLTPSNYSEESISVLFICVKNYSLEKTMNSISEMIKSYTVLIPLQNGLYSYNYLRSFFPNNVVLEGFVQGPNTRIYDGNIVYQNPGTYHLGKKHSGFKEYADIVFDILQYAGVPCVLEKDIRHAIWCKLMLNVTGNALTALTGLDYLMFKKTKTAQKVCWTIMREFQLIAETENITITEADIQDIINYFMTYKESKHTSMLEDVINKRPTENEYIAGYIKRLAAKNGVDAPFIELLYSIMRIKEDVYLGKL